MDNTAQLLQAHQAVITNTMARLDFERCWMLHRALTLNQQPEAESWKGSTKGGFTDEQLQELLDKYHALLLSL
jgi:hypothetical protein